jgi:hypothetical protein
LKSGNSEVLKAKTHEVEAVKAGSKPRDTDVQRGRTCYTRAIMIGE